MLNPLVKLHMFQTYHPFVNETHKKNYLSITKENQKNNLAFFLLVEIISDKNKFRQILVSSTHSSIIPATFYKYSNFFISEEDLITQT